MGSPLGGEAQQSYVKGGGGAGSSSSSWLCRPLEVVLRVLALLLSIAGAVVMAKDKQDIYAMLGNIRVPAVRAHHSYVDAFVFLVYANGIVAIYSFFALLVSFLAKRRGIAGLLFFMDQALAYLLLAAAASSTEASYIAKRGESQVGWAEVCSNIEHFCNLVGVSLVLTFLSVLVLITLAILSGKRLFGHGSVHAPPSTPTPQV